MIFIQEEERPRQRRRIAGDDEEQREVTYSYILIRFIFILFLLMFWNSICVPWKFILSRSFRIRAVMFPLQQPRMFWKAKSSTHSQFIILSDYVFLRYARLDAHQGPVKVQITFFNKNYAVKSWISLFVTQIW